MAQRVNDARRWKGGSRWEPPLYELSENDQWCNETRRRVALKVGEWLMQSNLLKRPVTSLRMWELEGIVEAAMAEYTLARAERYDAEEAKEQNPSSGHSLDLYGI